MSDKVSKKHTKSQLLEERIEGSPKAKGERLRRLRNLTGLSREEFCQDSDINLTTLISWEGGRFGGLSAKGASRVIARIAQEGVFCSLEWLLYEIGAGPEVKVDFKKTHQVPEYDINLTKEELDETKLIVQELALFKALNKDTIDFIVEDDVMLPDYQAGDYVAGKKRHGQDIKKLIGLDCIIQLKNGQILLRNLQVGPEEHVYNLICKNLQTSIKNSILYGVELASAAPIIWHRKRDFPAQ